MLRMFHFICRNANLSAFPEWLITNCRHLKEIDLSSNSISSMTFGKDSENNKTDDDNGTIGPCLSNEQIQSGLHSNKRLQSKFSNNIEYLILNNNRISELPDNFCK